MARPVVASLVVSQKYLIRTYGCQMNENDSERIAGVLRADGLSEAESEADADVVVLNTCCIRENADNKLYGALGNLKVLKDDNPNLEIIVGGCLAQKDGEMIRKRAPHVDVVFGTHNVHRLGELRHVAATSGPVTEILQAAVVEDHELFPSVLPANRKLGYASWMTIQIGCDNSCAFCIVPSVRGPEMSRPFGDLVAEVENLASDGVTQVTLLGQNVNSYGRDLAMRMREEGADQQRAAETCGTRWQEQGSKPRPLFSDLLRAVGDVEGIKRVRYTSPHPKDFRAETIAAMAETQSVCEHLHLPLQSGSDRILTAMHRGYTAERYLEKVAMARAGIEDLSVTTDIIVGFPGETEADFNQTLEVAAEAFYDSVFTYVYSERPGTEAAGSDAPQVAPEVSARRMKELRAVLERSSMANNAARVGRIEEVIVEGPSKRNPDRQTGRTRQNKVVHFESADPIRPGTYASVLVKEAQLKHLLGDLIEILDVPKHKTRLPLLSA